MKTWLLLTVSVFSLLLVPQSAALTYTTIDYPGATETYGTGINSNGDVVGLYDDPANVFHGFLFSNGIFTAIDPPGSIYTNPFDINDLGEIVGYYVTSDNIGHGFILQGSTYTTLDAPGNSSSTIAYSVNNAGEIVGSYTDQTNVAHGFILQNGVWTTVDLPHATESFITGINNNGDMFGSYCAINSGHTIRHAFLLSKGVFHVLVPPKNDLVNATGKINDPGEAVETLNTWEGQTPLVFVPPDILVLLKNISTSYPSKYMTAQGINGKGEIVGIYLDSQFVNHAYVAKR